MSAMILPRRSFLRQLSLSCFGGVTCLTPRLMAERGYPQWDPSLPFPRIGRTLRVQPVLMYRLPVRRDAASWKSWGGIQTEAAVAEESERISASLRRLAVRADFPLEFLPLERVETVEAARRLAGAAADVTLLYPCTGSGDLLRACLAMRPDTVLFVRRRSGPIYYWSELHGHDHTDVGNDRLSDSGPAER